MELRVLRVKDIAQAKKVLAQDWAKRTGAYMREEIGDIKGPFLVVRGDPAPFLKTGAFELLEDEEKLVENVKKEEESINAGVGLLGL